MAIPYQNVAKAALINWNGLSEEEAQRKIESESFQELENQVFAASSIKYAVIGISKQVGLTESETYDFFLAVINGPENAKIFDIVKEKAKGFTEEQELNVLSDIHDGWVQDNSSEKTFNKKVDRQQLRQYAPLELIGWNEAKSDLLFLNPVLESIGVQVNEEALEQAYHDRVVDYLEDNGIFSEDDLTDLIKQGREYYPALPEELEKRLLPMSEVVSEQIMKNWNENSPAISIMFIPEPQYEEIEVDFDDNLESIVYRLLAENAKGKHACCTFNGHILYSDKVTIDSVNSRQFDQDNREEELERMEQEYKNIYGDRVEVIEPGKVVIFPKS